MNTGYISSCPQVEEVPQQLKNPNEPVNFGAFHLLCESQVAGCCGFNAMDLMVSLVTAPHLILDGNQHSSTCTPASRAEREASQAAKPLSQVAVIAWI
ncbi:MAG: hypothetical protein EON54_21480 [Alcaligenaceae bacterium]|nr:MAG: hypothetical protein EON54_21480 [Alcaligenaceae bacterium]